MIKSYTEFLHLAGALIMEYFIAGPQLMYVLRKIFLKWNKRLDPLYYYLIEPVVTRLFDHSKLSQSKLGNPSSFSRSQTELGSILQMNKTKRNEGREKKLKFKSQYKNTFIFDWQNEKKSISYMSYGLNLKVPTIQQVLAKWAKISQSGSSPDPT